MSLTESSPTEVARAASIASGSLSTLSLSARNDALTVLHDALKDARSTILAANSIDVEAATKAAENGELSQSVLKRLDLSRKGKYDDMLKGILDVRELEDPGGWKTCNEIKTCVPVDANISFQLGRSLFEQNWMMVWNWRG
jgi:glutamate-5-semialdehyde dehydrogenase